MTDRRTTTRPYERDGGRTTTCPSTRTASTAFIATIFAAGLAACGGGSASSTATQAPKATRAPAADAAAPKTRLLAQSSQARSAKRRHAPRLLAPPLVVRDVGSEGIDVKVRIRLDRQIDLGLLHGVIEGTTRGNVSITGTRNAATTVFDPVPGGMDMEDSHGFTPNIKSPARGWCYGGEFQLGFKFASAKALTTMASGAPQTIKIVVTLRHGGGKTTYAVPIYDVNDRRLPGRARDMGCGWP